MYVLMPFFFVSEECRVLEEALIARLQEVLDMGPKEVTPEQMKLLLEKEMERDLEDYRDFISWQMLKTKGKIARLSPLVMV